MPGVSLSIAVKSADGRYLRANDDGSISFCTSDIMDPAIKFTVPAGFQIFLQSYKREFVSLTESGDFKLVPLTDSIDLNKVFTLVLRGANKVAVKANNQKYVTYDDTCVKAANDTITDNETFEIIHLYV
ncbi:MAG: hypothetical protein Q8900_03840 [Bacillota bacterium]|nr:hypothetical protein [Bacillota bacterium]